jgi:sigma-B regulation protein RsbQ
MFMIVYRDGLPIDYIDAGAGEVTLFFVHGSSIDKLYWQEQITHFKEHYRVIAIDLPGHGQSGKDRQEWTIEGFAADVDAVTRALNLSKVVLIGHSMGADVILEASALNPAAVLGLVVIDALKHAGTEMPEEVMQQVSSIAQNLRADFGNTVESYAKQGLLTNETDVSIVDMVTNDYRTAYPPMVIGSLTSIFGFAARERELLGQLRWKLHLINVDYIPTDESLLSKHANAGYELLILHGSCHFPMLEHPQELNHALEKVLHKIENPEKFEGLSVERFLNT